MNILDEIEQKRIAFQKEVSEMLGYPVNVEAGIFVHRDDVSQKDSDRMKKLALDANWVHDGYTNTYTPVGYSRVYCTTVYLKKE